MATWLVALALRGTVVAVAALLLGALLRRRRAVACHRLLTLAAASLLVLPVLAGLLPRWELRLPGIASVETGPPLGQPFRQGGAAAPFAVPRAGVLVASSRASAPAAGPGVGSPPSSTGAALGALASISWLGGVLISLLGLARALRRERWLLLGARPVGPPWAEALDESRRWLGVSRGVRLLTSDDIDAPLTTGWWRPVVLLPVASAHWSEERRRVVVQHELVHVRRADALRHLLWRAVVALYWFNPLVRLAAHEARAVGEHACDETVLDFGTRPSAYARHLLEIAESLNAVPRRLAHSLPMVERGQLSRRLQMILAHDRPAGRSGVPAAVSLVLLSATVAAVGAAAPRPRAAAAPRTLEPARPAAVARAGAAPAPAETTAAPSAPRVCLEGMGGSFSGTIDDGPSGAEWTGTEGGDFTLQHNLGAGRRLCARVRGAVRFDERSGSIGEVPPGASVSVETRGSRRSQVMRVTGEPGGPRYEWWVDGASRAVDAAAEAWLADALEVVAGYRAIGSIQGQVGSLQGQIGSIQGEVGSLQGQIGSVQGRIGSLQGKVGSIQGERGVLEGEIGSQQGAIGSLEGRRSQASAAEKARIDEEIATHRAAIEKIEAEMASRQFDRRIAEAEAGLRSEESKARSEIAALEGRIKDVRADERIGQLQRKIADLHAEDRIAEIERRMKPALERLEAAIDRLGA
jgi:beta-lactamase regulating signal transducer with metallopeptidase domain